MMTGKNAVIFRISKACLLAHVVWETFLFVLFFTITCLFVFPAIFLTSCALLTLSWRELEEVLLLSFSRKCRAIPENAF